MIYAHIYYDVTKTEIELEIESYLSDLFPNLNHDKTKYLRNRKTFLNSILLDKEEFKLAYMISSIILARYKKLLFLPEKDEPNKHLINYIHGIENFNSRFFIDENNYNFDFSTCFLKYNSKNEKEGEQDALIQCISSFNLVDRNKINDQKYK